MRSHSQDPPVLFYSRVSAGEGDDGRGREVEQFPASSLPHKERWVGKGLTFGAAAGEVRL